jgi:hypothetical protein
MRSNAQRGEPSPRLFTMRFHVIVWVAVCLSWSTVQADRSRQRCTGTRIGIPIWRRVPPSPANTDLAPRTRLAPTPRHAPRLEFASYWQR